jgi:TM2 domain-containing membrane protein YozV
VRPCFSGTGGTGILPPMSNLPPSQPNQPYNQPPQGQPAYGGPAYGGQPFPPQPGAYGIPARTSNGMAIAALVTGLLGCVPFLTGLLAIIFGILGIKRSKVSQSGKGMATAGLILGVLSLLGWAALLGTGGYALWQLRDNVTIAKQYMTALGAGTVGATAPDGSYVVTQADLDEYQKATKGLGTVKDTTTIPLKTNDEVQVLVVQQFSGGETKTFRVDQRKVNGQWKVTEFVQAEQKK